MRVLQKAQAITSSAHATSQGRRSSWRFLAAQHPPPTVTHSTSVLEDGNSVAVTAVLFLANLHFSFLVSQYRYCLIPAAHSVTCWRTVSSRSAASPLTVKSISNFFFRQFYIWLSLCALFRRQQCDFMAKLPQMHVLKEQLPDNGRL